MAIVFRLPAAQVVDANGNPLSGAKLRFYERGTTTPKNVFSDEGLTAPISQPVVANSAGQWTQIYMSADRYRVQLHTAAEVLVADWDNHDPGQPVSATAGVLPLALGGTGVTSLSALQALLGLGASATWTDVASAATTDIGAVPSTNVRITGTTGITSFGTAASGTTRQIRFAGTLLLTHNATSLILPGAVNITADPDDTATAVSLGSGNWIVVDYSRADGKPPLLVVSYTQFTTAGAHTWNKPAGTLDSDLIFWVAVGGGGGGSVNAQGAGGGGGAGVWGFAPAVRFNASEGVTVGAGGTAPGGNGGNTVVMQSLQTAFGGAGAATTNGGGGGGWDGAASGTTGGAGWNGGRTFGGGSSSSGNASSLFGGGAGASNTASVSAGASYLGGAGGGGVGLTAGGFSTWFASAGGTGGVNGTAGGTGCGGAGGSTSAGAGGVGQIRVWTIRGT